MGVQFVAHSSVGGCSWAGNIFCLGDSLSPAGGNRSLDARVEPGHLPGNGSPHGVPVDSELFLIRLGLLFEKGQPSPGRQGEDEPIVISWAVNRLYGFFIGSEAEVMADMLLGRINRPPVCSWFARFLIFQFTAAPVEGNAGIAIRCIHDNHVFISPLPTTVDLHKPRYFIFHTLRIGIVSGYPAYLIFKGAHRKGKHLYFDLLSFVHFIPVTDYFYI